MLLSRGASQGRAQGCTDMQQQCRVAAGQALLAQQQPLGFLSWACSAGVGVCVSSQQSPLLLQGCCSSFHIVFKAFSPQGPGL